MLVIMKKSKPLRISLILLAINSLMIITSANTISGGIRSQLSTTATTSTSVDHLSIPNLLTSSSPSKSCSFDDLEKSHSPESLLKKSLDIYLAKHGPTLTKIFVQEIIEFNAMRLQPQVPEIHPLHHSLSSSSSSLATGINRGRSHHAEEEVADQDTGTSSEEAYGEEFRGAVSVNTGNHDGNQGNVPNEGVWGNIQSNNPGTSHSESKQPTDDDTLSQVLPGVWHSSAASSSEVGIRPVMGSVSNSIGGRKLFLGNRMTPLMDPGSERVLMIPARRLRPFASKVRLQAKGKVREVKITTSPFMNLLDALKQTEIKIQWTYPELANKKVIEFGFRNSEDDWINVSDVTSSEEKRGGCYVIRRIGPYEEENEHKWSVKVTYRTGEVKFNQSCLPTKDDDQVVIRPGTVIDLIYS